MTLKIYLGDMGGIFLQPPKFDPKLETELGNVEPHVPSIAITEDHNGVGDIVEAHPRDNVTKDIQEDFSRHPTFFRQTDPPFSSDPISPHVLQFVGGNVADPFVHQPGRDDVTTGSDGDRRSDVLLAAATLVVEHVLNPNVSKNLDMVSTNCQGCLVLK